MGRPKHQLFGCLSRADLRKKNGDSAQGAHKFTSRSRAGCGSKFRKVELRRVGFSGSICQGAVFGTCFEPQPTRFWPGPKLEPKPEPRPKALGSKGYGIPFGKRGGVGTLRGVGRVPSGFLRVFWGLFGGCLGFTVS